MIKNPCIFIFLLAIAVSGKAQIPTDSLVAHYAFNNSLDDETGNGFNIFNTDIGFETDRFGNSLGAASFDGINDSLNFPFEVFSPIEGDFAFSLWFRSNNPEVQNLFSLKQFADDTTNNFEFQLSSHNRYYLEYLTQTFYQVFAYWNGTGQSNNAIASGFAGLLTNGKWHHMVFTRQGEVFGLYVDGQEYYLSVDNSFGDILGDGSFPVFGASPYLFKGALDDLRFYNKALSAWEVAQLWFEDRPLVFSTPERNEAYVQGSELLANWDYDDVVISDSVTVQYRVDGGPWSGTAHSGLAVENGVYLDLDFPIGSAIEIRVFDTLSPESEVVAGPIYISPYDWVEVTDALPFSARDGSGLLNFDNRLWLLGGWDPPNHPPHYTHSEVWTSTDGATWSYVLDAPWPARHCGGWIAGDDAMWVVGGDPQSNCLTDVWKSEDGTEWIQVLDAIPGYEPRHMANYAWFNNAIIMYGGEKCSLGGTSEVWTSSDGSSWEQLPDAPWSGRGMQLNYCVDDDGWLWMLGGSNEFSRRSYNEVWKTQNGIDWILVNDNAPWMGRYWHTVAWFDNKMWLLAGSATSLEQNDVWYSADGVEWFEFKSGTGNWPAGSRHAQSTTVYNNALWYICGINTNNVWKIVNTTATDIDTGISDRPSLSVYPNPGTGYFTVHLPGNFSGNVKVFDLTGMEILRVNPQSPVVDIDLSQYADGVYLLKCGWLPAIKLIKM